MPKSIDDLYNGLKVKMKTLRESIQLILQEAEESAASCPLPTQDLKLNTKNRDAAIKAKHIQYGPLNLSDEDYWERLAEHWNTTADVAKQSKCGNCAAFDISPGMESCMPGEIMAPEEIEIAMAADEPWETLGYCWMHDFKCHSARTCYTWAAGGPITDDEISRSWQERSDKPVSEGSKRKLRILR